jgi:hypothetical protein
MCTSMVFNATDNHVVTNKIRNNVSKHVSK